MSIVLFEQVNFREIPSHVLQKVCMYFTYKVRYTNSSTEVYFAITSVICHYHL